MKGKTQPVRVYELVGFRKLMPIEHISAYSIYERAFEEFSRGNYNAAEEGFAVFLRLLGTDAVAARHLDEVRVLIRSPPDQGWTCVKQLDEK